MTTDLTPHTALLVLRQNLVQQRSELDDQIKALDGQIKDMLGDDEEALVDGQPAVTWKTVVSKRVDQSWLKTEHPAVYDECIIETSSRRFVVTYTPPAEADLTLVADTVLPTRTPTAGDDF